MDVPLQIPTSNLKVLIEVKKKIVLKVKEERKSFGEISKIIGPRSINCAKSN